MDAQVGAMIAVDTCVLVRWVLRDDGRQAVAADAQLALPFFLGVSVLVELGWVLATIGRMSRPQIARALESLLGLPTAIVEHETHVRWAIQRYAAMGDLPDLIHLANSTDADGFVTFDKALLREAGPNAPVPVSILES